MRRPTLQSEVPRYLGPCVATWLNTNQVCHRLDAGISGFFKRVRQRWFGRQKYGPEFHGIIKGSVVEQADIRRDSYSR